MADLAFSIFLGVIAGLIPVYLGLIPTPYFKKASPSQRNFLISFSLGVLLFLFVEVGSNATELARSSSWGPPLFALGLVLGVGSPALVSHRRRIRQVKNPLTEATKTTAKMFTAYMISLGIGLHNLGEGLALGASYATNQLALTTTLVIGFAIHNGTEGMGISGPISDFPVRFKEPLLLGLIAGFPTVLGSAIGFLAYSSQIGSLFFSAAAGALLYVIIELLQISYSPKNTFVGVTIGILLMYTTGLLLPS